MYNCNNCGKNWFRYKDHDEYIPSDQLSPAQKKWRRMGAKP